jgi:hypothetical protein
MELMIMMCWAMVLPTVVIVAIQHVLDGGINVSTKCIGQYMYGMTDKVFIYMAVNHRMFFKSRVGHTAIHVVVAVVAMLTQAHK